MRGAMSGMHRFFGVAPRIAPQRLRPVWYPTAVLALARRTAGTQAQAIERRNDVGHAPSREARRTPRPPQISYRNSIDLTLDDRRLQLSPLLLRDSCTCPRCVDVSTRQKLFSTVDIPSDIQGTVANTGEGVVVRWTNDVPGYGTDHATPLSHDSLRPLVMYGSILPPTRLPSRILWNDHQFRADTVDIPYDAYMQDDATLYKALNQLHTHGLLFLTGVPEAETSVSTIAERIGPLKNTFYGMTWDVRSVPQAKNVAYTSQDLGFHMDLLYMKQPPHLQLLHCIRSSSAGGASTFTDSFAAAADLFKSNRAAFVALAGLQVDFHYNHPESHYYRQSRTVIETTKLRYEWMTFATFRDMLKKTGDPSSPLPGPDLSKISDWIDAISWAPPFQAPFSLESTDEKPREVLKPVEQGPTALRPIMLSNRVQEWHSAAKSFNDQIHRPEGIHERMMKPGECVIFDNRRVLHARRAFEVGDVGKERWLRGAYIDKDPYMSKLKVLQSEFGNSQDSSETTIE